MSANYPDYHDPFVRKVEEALSAQADIAALYAHAANVFGAYLSSYAQNMDTLAGDNTQARQQMESFLEDISIRAGASLIVSADRRAQEILREFEHREEQPEGSPITLHNFLTSRRTDYEAVRGPGFFGIRLKRLKPPQNWKQWWGIEPREQY